MKQLKNSNIIILGTSDEPILGSLLYREAFGDVSLWRFKESHVYGDSTKVYRTLGSGFEDWYKGMNHHHIYVLSDDEIKENDKVFDNHRKVILECPDKDNEEFYKLSKHRYKKIIATTDASLRVYDPCIQCDGTGKTTFSGTYTTQKECDLCKQLKYPNTKSLPQPSEELINKFVEDYNKEFRKGITFSIKDSNDKLAEKYRLALLQLKEYSDNELIIQEGVTLNINNELNKLV